MKDPIRVYHTTNSRESMRVVLLFDDGTFMLRNARVSDFDNIPIDDDFFVGELGSGATSLCDEVLRFVMDPEKRYPNGSFGITVSPKDFRECFFGSRSIYIKVMKDIMREHLPDMKEVCRSCNNLCCTTKGIKCREGVTNIRPEEFHKFKDNITAYPVRSNKDKGYETYSADGKYFMLDWNEEGRCPLLTKDNLCSVQADKPFGCYQFACYKVRIETDYNRSMNTINSRFVEILTGNRKNSLNMSRFLKDWEAESGSEYLQYILEIARCAGTSRLNTLYPNAIARCSNYEDDPKRSVLISSTMCEWDPDKEYPGLSEEKLDELAASSHSVLGLRFPKKLEELIATIK